MDGRKSILLKILVFLLVLNSVSLIFFYLTSHHHHPISSEHHPFPTQTRNTLTESNLQELKPWPILPSYLPWRSGSGSGSGSGVVVKYRSCEGYFGNGFGKKIDVIEPQSGGGWFRCWYSETLKSSICEGGRMRMDPGRIRMAKGGERIEDVIGRGEEVELPVFEDGAFGVDGGVGVKKDENGSGRRIVDEEFLNRYLPQGVIQKHTMRSLMGSIRLVGSEEFECSEWIEEPTLLVTRFEYANLFHTFTDWYSAYVSSRVTGLPNRPKLVFVDGHCKTQLEETWRSLFSSLKYAKNFSGSVCFRHAIFSPLGYETPLFKGLSESIRCDGAPAHELWQNPDDSKTARLSEFGEMIRAAYGFPVDRNMAPKSASGHNILFVRREDYLAHPRHAGKVQSRLRNEQEVFDALQSWIANYTNCKLNLVNGLFAHMPLKEQVRAIQDASVIIGAHGAGLTYIISAMPKTVILEIISAEYRRPHFALIAKWKGLEYHAINLHGSYAETAVVIRELSNIVSNLGC